MKLIKQRADHSQSKVFKEKKEKTLFLSIQEDQIVSLQVDT